MGLLMLQLVMSSESEYGHLPGQRTVSQVS